jgi:hypothetical protein
VRELWLATEPHEPATAGGADPAGGDGQAVIAIVEVAESSGPGAQPGSAGGPFADPEPIGPPAIS